MGGFYNPTSKGKGPHHFIYNLYSHGDDHPPLQVFFFLSHHHHLRGTKTQQRGKPQSMAVTLHHAAARALDPKSHAKRLFIFACCRRVFVTARATNFVTPMNHPAK